MRSSGSKRSLNRTTRSTRLGRATRWIGGTNIVAIGGAKLAGIGAVAVSVLLPLAIVTLPVFDRNGAVAGAIVAAVTNPASLFAARSPGARAPGALTQTKRARAVPVPHERVLSQERQRPPIVLPPITFVSDDFVPTIDILEPGVGPDIVPPSLPPELPLPPVFIPPDVPGPPPPIVTPPPPLSAVPEPATWAMMIIGFFTAGMAMRRGARPSKSAVETSAT